MISVFSARLTKPVFYETLFFNVLMPMDQIRKRIQKHKPLSQLQRKKCFACVKESITVKRMSRFDPRSGYAWGQVGETRSRRDERSGDATATLKVSKVWGLMVALISQN